MHFHHQGILMAAWWTCSLVNWFMMIGYYNTQYKKNLKYEDNLFWIISASLFSGFAGFIVSSWSFKFKYWGWRPFTKNEKDQMHMLHMLEGDMNPEPETNYFSGLTSATPILMPKRKMNAAKASVAAKVSKKVTAKKMLKRVK